MDSSLSELISPFEVFGIIPLVTVPRDMSFAPNTTFLTFETILFMCESLNKEHVYTPFTLHRIITQ